MYDNEMQTPKQYLDIREEVRASDKERKIASNKLRQAHADGRITGETMNRRLEHIATSTNRSTLEWAIGDLPREARQQRGLFDMMADYRDEHLHRFHARIVLAIITVLTAIWVPAITLNDVNGAGGVVGLVFSILGGFILAGNFVMWGLGHDA